MVLVHSEPVDAFRSVPHRSLGERVFTGRAGKPLSPRTAARWISEGITNAGSRLGHYAHARTLTRFQRRASGYALRQIPSLPPVGLG